MGIILSVCQQSRFGWQQTDGLQAFDARPLADNTVEGLFQSFPALSAIPEGLPAVVTIILSIGVTAMSKRQALIRKLTAVETTGEPTEAALVGYAYALGMSKNDLVKVSPRIGEAPFDSGRKMMSTVHKTASGIVQYTKGAPDVVINLCKTALIDGRIVPMDDDFRAKIAADNKRMADKALRGA